MNQNKHVIWSNINLNFDDWKFGLEMDYPKKTDDEYRELMYKINNDYLCDERTNLNIQLNTNIIIIGDIGRWNGRVNGYKTIDSGNIKDCLYSDCDYSEWYIDEKGDFCYTGYHHDGTNYYIYRAFKDNLTDDDIYDFQNLVYKGLATDTEINKYTEPLGERIGAVYGWGFNDDVRTH